MKRLLLLGAVILASGMAFAQTPATAPAFDAADVHLRARTSNPNPFMSGGVLRSGRYDLRDATMVDLITTAYGVEPERVLGGPSWLEWDRFDVIAKAPQTTTKEGLQQMLQNLLADRFGLVVRRDTRPMPSFALTTLRTPHKLKESTGGAPGTCVPVPQSPDPNQVPYTVVSCRNTTLEQLVQLLRNIANAYVPDPATDETGLTGAWDFELKWTPRNLLAQAGSDAVTLSDALEKQLGLKLEARKAPQPVLLVDRVNQQPKPNPSGVAATLPAPPPAEFDVASIKLSPPGSTNMPSGRIQPGGRVDVQNFPLRTLITLAWDINSDELLAAPKWIDDTAVTIVARASAASVGGGSDGVPLDIDDVRQMLRALLIERFVMKTHYEDRAVTAFTLLADKPKLATADAANRTNCKNGPGANGRDPRTSNPVLSRLVTCQNMTMAQFAEVLPRMAPGYIQTQVADHTGLSGAWDFTFNFSPANAVRPGAGRGGGDGGRGAGVAPTATGTDPTGAVSLPDALKKDLGIKLETEKRPMPVLVIDSMERTPID